ncbi:hypothetical protein AMTRI_Chr02g257160 [Amborella trichopoda]
MLALSHPFLLPPPYLQKHKERAAKHREKGEVKGGEVTMEREIEVPNPNNGQPCKSVTLEVLKGKMADFAKERDWDQFHSPRNLLLALVGEVGELSEIFQWKGEVPKGLPDWKEEEKLHLGEELSDVLLYLVRLADICGVDLGKAALRKVELNAIKYPVKQCDGYNTAEQDE